MDNDKEIVQSLITGGIIGAALGTLLSRSKETGITLGALAGAAILATFKVNEAARKTKIPMFFEENNALYEIKADGSKHFVKNIENLQKNYLKLLNFHKMTAKRMRVFAGPNGSGKTT